MQLIFNSLDELKAFMEFVQRTCCQVPDRIVAENVVAGLPQTRRGRKPRAAQDVPTTDPTVDATPPALTEPGALVAPDQTAAAAVTVPIAPAADVPPADVSSPAATVDAFTPGTARPLAGETFNDYFSRRTPHIKVGPVEHIKLANEWIKAFGHAKYGSTLQLCGLSSNIMEFDAAQSAAHIAAMEYIAAQP